MRAMRRLLWPALLRISGNFWFLPGSLALLSLALAALCLWLDERGITAFLADVGPPFSFHVEGARSLLAVVAGSIITVASLVFSLTLVALTLAAGNIGSRLLQRYMRKTTMQMTLGIFVGTFLYTMVVLAAVAEGAVPPLSLGIALLLTIVSIFWLIYAFHDLSRSIQVDTAVAELADDLDRSIRKRAVRNRSEAREIPGVELPLLFSVPAERDGYLQAIDHDNLVAAARTANAVVTLTRRSGTFVLEGEEVARIAMAVPQVDEPSEKTADIARAVHAALVQGMSRAQGEDPTFAVHLIVEIAGRALSPGVNDFYTALACVDHIGSALATSLRLQLHSGRFADDEGCVRLISNELTFRMIADNALDALRQCAGGHPPVLLHLLQLLVRLAPLAGAKQEREVLSWHGQQLLADANRLVRNPADLQAIEAAHDQLGAALKKRAQSA